MIEIVRVLEFDDPRAALPDDAEYGPPCPHCGGEMESEACWACHGEGGHYPYEANPIEYLPDEFKRCEECRGQGRYWVCSNSYDWCAANPRPKGGE